MITALILALLLGLALPASGEGTDRYILSTGGSAVLTDEAGQILIGPGRFADMTALGEGGLYAATELGGTLMGLVDETGEALTPFDLQDAQWDGERVVFSRDGLWGVMDASGGTVIEARYTRLVRAGEGGYLALRTDPYDDLPDTVYHVSPDGGESAAGATTAMGLEVLSGGYAAYTDNLGRWGYLDEAGDVAIEAAFRWGGPFIEDRAAAAGDGGAGLIDGTGRWVVEPVWRRVERSSIPGAPALAVGDGVVALLSLPDGAELARFEGEGVDAVFAGEAALISYAGGASALVDFEGRVLASREGGVARMTGWAGCVIVEAAPPAAAPFSFIAPDGAAHGAWQGLTPAGLDDGTAYFIAMSFDARPTSYEPSGLTFYDEVEGTRRYSLVRGDGTVVSEGYTSLRRTGHALLTAETDNWIGLIRPDGEIIMRLEKEE